MKFLKIACAAMTCILIGMAAGYLLRDRIAPFLLGTDEDIGIARTPESSSGPASEAHSPGNPPEKKRKILFYRNPMNPAVTSPVPKKDEMGMDYVPVYQEGGPSAQAPGTVTIDPVVEQNMGVRTGIARMKKMSHRVRTYARVEYDQTRIFSIHPRFAGWLERVLVTRQGDFIKKEQLLATIYSPELVSTQQDYLLALRAAGSLKKTSEEVAGLVENNEALVRSARKRLRLFGVTSSDINRLQRTGRVMSSLEIRSPYTGTAIRLKAVDGLAVTPATELYAVANLSTVWIMADVYEPDFPWIRLGDRIRVTSAAMPGRIFSGRVEFIYPYENQEKRTVRVRMAAENPESLLKPGMFVNAVIDADPRMVLAVPSEAVMRTGTRSLVFINRAPGKFEPRDVTTGVETAGYTEITKGLKQGERIVLSGQFLIDSESRLREATLKMISGKKDAETRDMKDMDMGGNDEKQAVKPKHEDGPGNPK